MNTILKQFLFLSSIYLLAPTANAFSLDDAISSGSQALSIAADVNGEAPPRLTDQLTTQLGVTQAQATGGTTALMQLAASELGASQLETLTDTAPGLSALMGPQSGLGSQLMSGIGSMDGVQSAFSALGMDSGMVAQFAPIILSFLGEQGVGSSLLGQLGGLWAPVDDAADRR